MTADALTRDFSRSVRAVRMAFLKQVDPHRAALFRYCRALTPTVWEAEDLLQETLYRAFAKLAEAHWDVERPRAYLMRTATHLWIDRTRRAGTPVVEPAAEEVDPGPAPELAPEVREALAVLARRLPPQERVALLLKDVFDLSLDETAAALGTTRGAVKAALHRGRGRLAAARDEGEGEPRSERAPLRPAPDPALLDAFVAAFNARDLERLAALFRDDAVAEVVGMVDERGREQIQAGSLHHTLFDEEGDPRAERVDLDGEPLLVLWYTRAGERAVEDVLRLADLEGGLSELRYYYFCPELLAEVVGRLGLPLRTNGYRYV